MIRSRAHAWTECLRIHGGRPLHGTVAVSGSKNASLPILAATLLADEPIHLAGVPDLLDVSVMRRILSSLGVSCTETESGDLEIQTVDTAPVRAAYALVRQMRAGFCVLGPMLARRGSAIVALPGGCNIGQRPVDLHLAGLTRLGADISLRRGYVIARARRLRGTDINLAGCRGPTVTGTANVMSAATLARGRTVIHGAACEPEIVDLANFLRSLGARIDGAGSATLEIDGVQQLGSQTDSASNPFRIIPDRIEAATLLIATAITGGMATVVNVIPEHVQSVLDALTTAGASLVVEKDRVRIKASDVVGPLRATALPYPGIPTDVQSQLLALACIARGDSVIRDQVFPERWMHIAELARMGAAIERTGDRAVVRGRPRGLQGAHVSACDLRASAALVLAGLAANGTTVIHRIHHLDRGYQRLEEKLGGMGASILRREAAVPGPVKYVATANAH